MLFPSLFAMLSLISLAMIHSLLLVIQALLFHLSVKWSMMMTCWIHYDRCRWYPCAIHTYEGWWWWWAWWHWWWWWIHCRWLLILSFIITHASFIAQWMMNLIEMLMKQEMMMQHMNNWGDQYIECKGLGIHYLLQNIMSMMEWINWNILWDSCYQTG